MEDIGARATVCLENRYRKSNIFTNCRRHVKINEYAINLLHGNNEAKGISMNITSHLLLPPPCTRKITHTHSTNECTACIINFEIGIFISAQPQINNSASIIIEVVCHQENWSITRISIDLNFSSHLRLSLCLHRTRCLHLLSRSGPSRQASTQKGISRCVLNLLA